MIILIPLGGLVNIDKEKFRMKKRIMDINRLLKTINGKLLNENFMKRAPENVIIKEKSNFKKLTQELDKIKSNLKMLE